MALRVVTSLLGHLLSKDDVGLDQVDNTSDANKPIATATATALAAKATTAALTAHSGDVANPHAVTKAQVGLGSADNTSDAGKPVSTAQATAIALKADASALTAHTGDVANPHAVTKAQVGLGSVDNTSDAAKPISTATSNALNGKQPLDADLTVIAALSGADGSFLGRSGGSFALRTAAQTKADLSLDNVPNTKHNLTATTGPGVGNDNTQGYAPGSLWVNTMTNIAYICVSAATGLASWRNLAFVTSAASPLVESGGGLSLPAAAGPSTNGYLTGADKAKLDALATRYYDARATNVACPASSVTTMFTTTLPAGGIWLVEGFTLMGGAATAAYFDIWLEPAPSVLIISSLYLATGYAFTAHTVPLIFAGGTTLTLRIYPNAALTSYGTGGTNGAGNMTGIHAERIA